MQHSQEGLGVHIISSVVLRHAGVDIGSARFVDHIAWDRVVAVVSDVIVVHDHNLLVRNAILVDDLISSGPESNDFCLSPKKVLYLFFVSL